jgi:hypothetical protein
VFILEIRVWFESQGRYVFLNAILFFLYVVLAQIILNEMVLVYY